MRRFRHATAAVLASIALMLVLVAIKIPAPSVASAQEAGGSKWVPISVIYLSDTRGKIEPCG